MNHHLMLKDDMNPLMFLGSIDGSERGFEGFKKGVHTVEEISTVKIKSKLRIIFTFSMM